MLCGRPAQRHCAAAAVGGSRSLPVTAGPWEHGPTVKPGWKGCAFSCRFIKISTAAYTWADGRRRWAEK